MLLIKESQKDEDEKNQDLLYLVSGDEKSNRNEANDYHDISFRKRN